MDNYVIGQYIRSLRESVGFTQQFVANKLGCSKNTISEMENGNRSFHLDQIVQIAALFKVTPESFFRIQPLDKACEADNVYMDEMKLLLSSIRNQELRELAKLQLRSLVDSPLNK